MIRISNLNKNFGEQTLFTDVNLAINEGEKIGLIGRNGTGKTTFLKLLLEHKETTDGDIEIPPHYKIRTLEQNLNFTEDTVLKQVCTALPEDALGEQWKAKSILMGLGFFEEDFSRSPTEFSNGYQVRIRLAEALVSEPNLLLLDEPTNYLDILSLRWLSRFLQNWRGTFILITHDRHFMTEVVTHTIAIHRGTIRKMKGGPKKLMDHIEMDEEIYEKTRLNQAKKKKKADEFIRTFRAGARSAGLVQSRIKALEKQEIKNKLANIRDIKFHFHSEPFHGTTLLEVSDLKFGYTEDKILIDDLTFSVFPGDRIAVIGRNGKGKSTLLHLLTKKLQPLSGKVAKKKTLKIGYFGTDSIAELNEHHSILEELVTLPGATEQEVRGLCGSLLFTGEAPKKKIATISGCEKSRVCLGKVILFTSNILVLDEPTNHLDMESCQALTAALKDYKGAVIFVTHDEGMIERLANRLIVFDRGQTFMKNKTYSEFLESGGWSEEEEIVDKASKRDSIKKQEYLDKKEVQKRLRAIQKRQVEIEKELDKLDTQQKANAEILQKVCLDQDYTAIKELSEKAKEITDDIDADYSELEELINEETELQEATSLQ